MNATEPSRRDFLVGGGALTLLLLANGTAAIAGTQIVSAQIGAWVTITSDDAVTIKVPATEMGQGVMTALPVILAEELDADWSKVKVETVTGDEATFGNPRLGGRLLTVGSAAVEGYFAVMRKAGGAARRALMHMAALHWSVTLDELTSEPGVILHRDSGLRLRFGEIAALPARIADLPQITEADLKPRTAFRLIGVDVPRLDVPAKVAGAAIYSIDVRIPDMVHASVLRAPVEGETLLSVVDKRTKAEPGVLAVVRLPDAIAVVAEHWSVARDARDLLTVEWTRGSPFRTADSASELAELARLAADTEHPGIVWTQRGEPLAELSRGARLIEAEYSTEHVYHAQMEPLAVVVKVDDDGKGADVWIGTQNQTLVQTVGSQILQTAPERIRCHPMLMGGGFGRRASSARDLLRDALLISQEVKRPVKVIWTREDDVKLGWYRPATAHKLSAALDKDGNLVAWRHRIACPSVMAAESSPEALGKAGNKDNLVMGGTDAAPYAIPHILAEHVITPRRSRLASWRGIGHGHNRFASECFIDELATAAKIDPVIFRHRLLDGHPRARALLDKVVALSKFGAAPEGRAHGLALGPLRSSLAAGVAEVSLDRATGAIRVHRFWAAVDTGIAVQPRNLKAQVEGGIIFGLSGALKERITLQNGEVRQSNYHDYEVLRMSEVPEIWVEIMPSDAPPTGAGELGVPMTGAAVANAVYALAGVRLRHMPFNPERVKALLAS